MSGARREDGRILRGQTRYLDDIILPGIAEVAFVRSPHAHASIEAIEVPAGVTAVTAADLDGLVQPYPLPVLGGAELAPAPHPVLAHRRGRLRRAAGRARDRRLPRIGRGRRRARGGRLRAAPSRRRPARFDHHAAAVRAPGGDVEEAFAAASQIVSGSYALPRLAAYPIETRGAIARYERDELTVWCSAQDPHRPRAQLRAHPRPRRAGDRARCRRRVREQGCDRARDRRARGRRGQARRAAQVDRGPAREPSGLLSGARHRRRARTGARPRRADARSPRAAAGGSRRVPAADDRGPADHGRDADHRLLRDRGRRGSGDRRGDQQGADRPVPGSRATGRRLHARGDRRPRGARARDRPRAVAASQPDQALSAPNAAWLRVRLRRFRALPRPRRRAQSRWRRGSGTGVALLRRARRRPMGGGGSSCSQAAGSRSRPAPAHTARATRRRSRSWPRSASGSTPTRSDPLRRQRRGAGGRGHVRQPLRGDGRLGDRGRDRRADGARTRPPGRSRSRDRVGATAADERRGAVRVAARVLVRGARGDRRRSTRRPGRCACCTSPRSTTPAR